MSINDSRPIYTPLEQQLSGYILQNILGKGGAATVYRALHIGERLEVAVKIIHAHFAEDREAVMRFQREGWTASKLQHPNIVPVLEYGEEDLRYYIVMKLFPGPTLRNILGQPLELARAVDLITQIGSALHYTHQLGVVHRDVKPSNILLDTQGQAYLTDFGIARFLYATATLTAKGLAVGTPEYMSPEQVEASTVDGRSDQYSLALILYQMLTGVRPFTGSNIVKIMTAQLHEPVPDPRKYRPELTEALIAVLVRALAKKPQDRYPNILAFVDALNMVAKQ